MNKTPGCAILVALAVLVYSIVLGLSQGGVIMTPGKHFETTPPLAAVMLR